MFTFIKAPRLTTVFSVKYIYLVIHLEHLYETFGPVLCSCAKDLMRPSHDKIISSWILRRGSLDYAETSGKNSQCCQYLNEV